MGSFFFKQRLTYPFWYFFHRKKNKLGDSLFFKHIENFIYDEVQHLIVKWNTKEDKTHHNSQANFQLPDAWVCLQSVDVNGF